MQRKSGMEVFHNGRPMRLLYLVDEVFGSQIWRVKPLLFPAEPERDEVFDLHDKVSFVHTNNVRSA